jgi:diaminopimelate decarboxylase
VTKVLHKKHIYKEYVGVDACAANLMRPAMYGSYHHITVLGKEDAECTYLCDVTGGLCENNDKFAIDRMLPPIEIGDTLVFERTGAYSVSEGMALFLSRELPEVNVYSAKDGLVQLRPLMDASRFNTPSDMDLFGRVTL